MIITAMTNSFACHNYARHGWSSGIEYAFEPDNPDLNPARA